MNVLALDTETYRIQPGILAPPLVCVSWATAQDLGLYNAADGLLFARECLEKVNRQELVLALLNAPYDMGVLAAADPALLPLIFKAYELGGIRDVKERQKLLDLAEGEMKFTRDADGEFVRQYYTLAFLARRHLGRELEKPSAACTSPYKAQCACGSWRLHYWQLADVPIKDWSPDAVAYAIEDAVATLDIDAIQRNSTHSVVVDPFGAVTNELEQYRAGWAFHLMSIWGIRTDGDVVSKLKAKLIAARDIVQRKLREGYAFCPACAANTDNDPTSFFGATTCAHCQASALTQHPNTVGTCLTCGLKNPLDVKKCAACKSKSLSTGVLKWHTPGKGKNKGVTKVTKNTAEMKRLVVAGFQAQGREVPKTDTGDISIARETLEESKDPTLAVMATGLKDEKLLTTYVPILEQGTLVPINARYNTLVETGRASCAEPNMMNPPRKGGVREAFVPRPGWVFSSVDYEQVELCTLAQVLLDLFKESAMADAINAGKDLHIQLAADILGIDYDNAYARHKVAKVSLKEKGKDWVKQYGDQEILDTRQLAKVPGFGYPGGMGPIKLVEFAKATYGLVIALDPDPFKPNGRSARELKEVWLRRWPEMIDYFAHISRLVGKSGEGTVIQPRSGRVRGGTPYCAAANSNFQGLAADGAKRAVWQITRECWEPQLNSPLYGCRLVIFMHDETVLEIPDDANTHAAATRQAEVMIHEMKHFVPDVKIGAVPALMRRWYKDAEAAYDPVTKKLIPWEPKVSKEKAVLA